MRSPFTQPRSASLDDWTIYLQAIHRESDGYWNRREIRDAEDIIAEKMRVAEVIRRGRV